MAELLSIVGAMFLFALFLSLIHDLIKGVVNFFSPSSPSGGIVLFHIRRR